MRPKKQLGQHFLINRGIAARIVGSLDGAGCDTVLEVGPGTGALTHLLAEAGYPRLTVVELDREAVDYLQESLPAGVEIISGDFLKLDLQPLGDSIALIGNFPYNISSQIFFRVLENRDRIKRVVCMIQKEVADRITAPHGGRSYGILSVLLGAWYDIEYLFTVSPRHFSPPPAVQSAVIRMSRNGTRQLDCDEELFVKVVKCCFNQRRKMIRNPLRALVGHDAGEMPLLTLRAEQLPVSAFVELTNWVAANRRDDQNE